MTRVKKIGGKGVWGGFVAGVTAGIIATYIFLPFVKDYAPIDVDVLCETTPVASIQVGEMQPYFCPGDGCANEMVELFHGADSSIDCAVYSFTHDQMSQALVDAKSRGVSVRVFMDDTQAGNQYSEDELLLDAGIEVRLDERSAYMHNKYCIIDDEIITTGSFNFSKNADTRNDENFLILHSSELARIYENDFNRLWQRQ